MNTQLNAKPGEFWKFQYVNSSPGETRSGKILTVRDTNKYPIRSGKCIRRTRYLVTMQTLAGIRSFYADSLMVNARKMTIWERIRFYFGR